MLYVQTRQIFHRNNTILSKNSSNWIELWTYEVEKKIKVLNSKNAGLTWFFKMFSRFYVVYLIKFQAVYAF